MPAPFAAAGDLPKGWRPLSADETERADWLLAKGSRLIRSEIPSVDAQIAAGTLDPELVSDVVCDMVRRQLTTPTDRESAMQATESRGPFSVTMSYVNPSGEPYLTKAERRRLGVRQRAASISTEPAPVVAASVIGY